MQLFLGLGLGFGGHPVEAVDVFGHGLFDGQGHVEGALLLPRWEVFGDVDLSERFAHLAVDPAGAALPALLLLFGAVQGVRVEVPALGFKRLGHAGIRVSVEQVPAQIGLDLVERGSGDEGVELGKKLGLSVVHLARGRGMGGGDIFGELEVREHFFEAGDVGGVVQILRIALLGDGQRGLGQLSFDSQNRSGVFGGLGVRLAGEDEHLAHMIDVLLALFFGFGVGAGVVIALGQAQAAGGIEADDLAGVGKVLARAHVEEGIDADAVQVGQ